MRTLVVFAASAYAQVMPGRVRALAVVVAVCSLVIGSTAAQAAAKPGAGPFAEFRACMKAHGAPTLDHKLSAEERAGLRRAFAACRGLLPKPARPSAAQVAAFKTCMAGKGFSRSSRPDLRDPAVRTALKAALKACLPLLKPKPASTG